MTPVADFSRWVRDYSMTEETSHAATAAAVVVVVVAVARIRAFEFVQHFVVASSLKKDPGWVLSRRREIWGRRRRRNRTNVSCHRISDLPPSPPTRTRWERWEWGWVNRNFWQIRNTCSTNIIVSREILHPHISIFVKDAQQKHCVCDINNKLSVPSNFLVCACKKRILVLSIFHVFFCMNIKLMEEIFLFTHNLF